MTMAEKNIKFRSIVTENVSLYIIKMEGIKKIKKISKLEKEKRRRGVGKFWRVRGDQTDSGSRASYVKTRRMNSTRITTSSSLRLRLSDPEFIFIISILLMLVTQFSLSIIVLIQLLSLLSFDNSTS